MIFVRNKKFSLNFHHGVRLSSIFADLRLLNSFKSHIIRKRTSQLIGKIFCLMVSLRKWTKRTCRTSNNKFWPSVIKIVFLDVISMLSFRLCSFCILLDETNPKMYWIHCQVGWLLFYWWICQRRILFSGNSSLHIFTPCETHVLFLPFKLVPSESLFKGDVHCWLLLLEMGSSISRTWCKTPLSSCCFQWKPTKSTLHNA